MQYTPENLTTVAGDKIKGLIPVVFPQEAQQLKRYKNVLTIDARTEEEYSVSHIAGALLSPSFEKMSPGLIKKLNECNEDDNVIVYCSLGARSEQKGKEILDQFPNLKVRNLFGGIFLWANEGRPVDGPGAPAIHPYSKKWAALLKEEYRAQSE